MKNLSEKNIMIFCLIWLVTFFIILTIWYCNKEIIDEKLVVAENIKEINISNELNIGLYDQNKIENLNPIENNSKNIKFISNLIYNGLFEYSKENILKPILISEYAKVDEKNYVFKLKENIYFHNGQALTSRNVRDTVEKIYLNENSEYSECVKNIQNIKIIDNNMFRINLIDVEENFEKNLTFPIICDVPNCGTNMYKLKEIINNQITITQNSEPQILNFYIYNELNNMYSDFKNKKIDLINSVDGMDYRKHIGEFGYQEKSYKGNKYMYLNFNSNKRMLFENTKLQEAVFHCINKKEIIEKVYNNYAFEIENFEYNLDKTVEILENQGYIYKENNWQNKESLKIVLLLNEKELTKLEIAYIIKGQLEKVGINLELNIVNEYEYYEKIKSFQYDILIDDSIENDNGNLKTDNFLFCNKLSLLYSYDLIGEIMPNSKNIFLNINTWKKVL